MKPKYAALSTQTFGLRKAPDTEWSSTCALSASIFRCSIFLSASLSQRASAILSFSTSSSTTPSIREGMASSRNSHFHPAIPCTPLNAERIQPDSGPPITPAIGMPVMKSDVTLARRAAGYQYVRYRMMPGKKPASATPSRKRRM